MTVSCACTKFVTYWSPQSWVVGWTISKFLVPPLHSGQRKVFSSITKEVKEHSCHRITKLSTSHYEDFSPAHSCHCITKLPYVSLRDQQQYLYMCHAGLGYMMPLIALTNKRLRSVITPRFCLGMQIKCLSPTIGKCLVTSL